MTASSPSPRLAQQVVPQLLGRVIVHGKPKVDAALSGGAAKVWQRRPADNASDVSRTLYGAPGHVHARNDDRLRQRRLIAVISISTTLWHPSFSF